MLVAGNPLWISYILRCIAYRIHAYFYIPHGLLIYSFQISFHASLSIQEESSYSLPDVLTLKEWKKDHMNDFVKMTDSFMEQLELPESKPRVQTYETFYKQENDKPLDP